MGNNPPFRAAPVRVLVPPTAESSTTVCRRFLRTGDRSSMPRILPQPNNGEVHIFFSREGLVSHFNSIPADQRGNLYNEDPDAFRGQVRSSGEDGPLPPLAAIPRGIGNIPVSRPHYIYLVEQYGWGTTVMTGIGTARRATTSTPPSSTPEGHVAAAGAHGQCCGAGPGLPGQHRPGIPGKSASSCCHLSASGNPGRLLGCFTRGSLSCGDDAPHGGTSEGKQLLAGGAAGYCTGLFAIIIVPTNIFQ